MTILLYVFGVFVYLLIGLVLSVILFRINRRFEDRFLLQGVVCILWPIVISLGVSIFILTAFGSLVQRIINLIDYSS